MSRHVKVDGEMTRRSYLGSVVAVVTVVTAMLCVSAAAQSLQVIDHPSAGVSGTTVFTGISDGRVVGYWGTPSQGSFRYGGAFVYSGGSFTPLAFPGGTDTRPNGISGANVVGQYTTSSGITRAFVYDGTNYVGFDYPVAPGTPVGTEAIAANAGTVIGSYQAGTSDTIHGFIRSPAGAFTTLDYPGSIDTALEGISANRIVGDYFDDAIRRRGFVYENSAFTPLDYPGSIDTFPQDVQGQNVVGFYGVPVPGGVQEHGFLFDGSTWSTFDVPGASGTGTRVYGIDGNTVVGSFQDTLGRHGFIATVPEPSSVLILMAVAGLSRARRPRRAKSLDRRI